MEGTPSKSTSTIKNPPLHTLELLRRTPINRAFAAVYTCAILALFYHHSLKILHSTTLVSFFTSFPLLISDVVLAFMWATTQSFRMRPVRRRVFLENLEKVMKSTSDFPALDVFICTADPFKEPPMSVVNTALSVMAYDYPTEKISVYVSDDGGSELTLFAFMEAAKFASHWLPFCRENNIVERCPEVYFKSNNHHFSTEADENIKMMYESMKVRVENVVERREVGEDYINGEEERKAYQKWSSDKFTPQDHPTVIQVLLESDKERDTTGHLMPNLVYVSRQKSRASHHHFKAGALNVLLRVSATMTNAPIILTQDCDMYSNDPQTPRRALCYFSDPKIRARLGFVQFPQRFHGINKDDIYACEHKHLYQIKPVGMDGLAGPSYVGSGCFFSRRVFFGAPSSFVPPEIQELTPHHVIDKPIQSKSIMALAHHVASCNYESETKWGSKMGFRYGSLSEDYNTGYRMHCEGWRSVFCHPERAAFLGDVPITLFEVLNQNKRWAIGLLQISLSKFSPATFGVWSTGLLMGLASSHDPFWPFLSIPMMIYATLPQLALLNRISIFPKVLDPWFLVHAFLFLGAYTQDFLDFVLAGGTAQRWWNNQRMWMIRGLSSYLFGFVEYLLKSLGVSMHGFNVTSKIVDGEQRKRYDQGVFEFGVTSPMFVTLTTAAIINIVSFTHGLIDVLLGRNVEGIVVQMFIAGFVVVNCWPIYEAVLLRSDRGKMPRKVTIVSTFLAWVLYKTSSLLLLEKNVNYPYFVGYSLLEYKENNKK